jgi:hypothetical protein
VDLLDRFLAQVAMVQTVWMPFLVLLAVLTAATWRGLTWHYRERIESLEHRVRLRDDTIANLERGAAAPIRASASEQKRPATEPINLPPLGFAPPPNSSRDRIFVPEGVNTEFLRNLYEEGHTNLQADKLAQAYIGKWIRVQGSVSNVSKIGEKVSVLIKGGHSPFDADYLTALWLSFEADHERLEMLRSGDTVTAIGKIDRFGKFDVHLEECELVKAE